MNALLKALHERALEVASQYRIIEADLLEILSRLDDKKVFRALGYASLFQYAVKELKLSEGTAYNFITVARKAREIPEIKAEIKSGNLSVSTVRKIASVIQVHNAAEWLSKAKSLPRPVLEKEVAKIASAVLTPEKAKYVTEDRIAVQLGVSEDAYKKLLRVKDILSQKLRKAASLEDAIVAMSDLYLEKNDPLPKAERAREKLKLKELVHGTVDFTVATKHIPAAVRHEVIARDNYQCSEQLPSGERCEQKRWLEMHHKESRKDGGAHSVNNLQLLCFGHHRGRHVDAVT